MIRAHRAGTAERLAFPALPTLETALPPPAAAAEGRHRSPGVFLLVWLGQAVSFIGSRTAIFAIGVTLYLQTGSVTRFTLIGLSIAIPMVLLSPVAGVVADRFDRRRLLLVSNAGALLGTLGLYAVLGHGGQVETWHIYPLIGLQAAFTAFTWPAFTAATTLLVRKEQFARAAGMNRTGQAVGRIAGPLLGAAALVVLPLAGIVLIDAATYLFSVLVLLAVRFPPLERPPEEAKETEEAAGADRGDRSRRLGEAWSFISTHRGFLYILLLFAGVNFALGFVQVLLPPMVLSFTSPMVLGRVSAFGGVGMLLGGLLVTVWGGPARHVRMRAILMLAAAEGLCLILGGLRPSATLVAAAAFLFLFTFPIVTSATQALWQAKVPPELQGRVMAVRAMIVAGAMPVAIALAGPLSDHLFEPLLAAGGPLVESVGQLVGVGPGRGIGALFVLLGLLVVGLAAGIATLRSVRHLESLVPDAVEPDAVTTDGARRADPACGLPRLSVVPAVLFAASLAGVALLAVAVVQPPAPKSRSAPVAEFSAGRALEHVRAVAVEPHPTGSAAARRVRDYLLAELEGLGLETRVQQAAVAVSGPALSRLLRVENVLARQPGERPAPGRGVLLVAHYDSVFQSPGAADNGAAVAALLEVARALDAVPPLDEDVYFLFSDGEELGLAGARAFLRHPWARDIGVVVNFEARGSRGPVYMFETGFGAGWWLRELLAAVPRPFANSLMRHVYEHLPNDTDFTVFREAGYAGFNLAFIDGVAPYHNMLDTAEALDPASLQHQGDYGLSLAGHFAASGAPVPPEGGREPPGLTYFNLLGPLAVHYPSWLAWASAAAVVALWLHVWVVGRRREVFTTYGFGLGVLAFLFVLLAVPVAATLLWFAIRELAGVPVLMGSTFGAPLFMAGFTVLALGLGVTVLGLMRRLVRWPDLAMGALAWWLLLVLLTSGIYLPPESNFLFVWPLLFALLGLRFVIAAPPDGERSRGGVALVLGLCAVPGILLTAPVVALFYVGLQGLFELGGAALVPAVLLLGLLMPQLELVVRGGSRWRLQVPALAGGAVLLALAVGTQSPPVAHGSVFYGRDLDRGESYWFSLDRHPEPWVRSFGFGRGRLGSVEGFFPWLSWPVPRLEAPAAELPRTRVEVLGAERTPEGTELHLRLESREHRARALWFDPADAVTRIEWEGEILEMRAGRRHQRSLVQQIPVLERETLRVTVRAGTDPLTMTVVEQFEGLPPLPGVEPRPLDLHPRPSFSMIESDTALVRSTFALTGGDAPARSASGSGEDHP